MFVKSQNQTFRKSFVNILKYLPLLNIQDLIHKNEGMDVFKRFGVDTAVEMVELGKHRQYRQHGIASKLMQAARLFCEGLGLSPVCLKGEGTSIYSQKIIISPVLSDTNISDKFMLKSSVKNIFISSSKINPMDLPRISSGVT
jgi:hypothetical protein